MKSGFVKIILSVLLIASALSLFGCGDRVKRDEAKETVESFLSAVSEENYELAAEFLHPDKAYDVEALIERIESELFVDFGKGVEVERYHDFSSSYYDSDVDGSDYSFEMSVRIGGILTELEISVVRNDGGYGIYSIEFED